MPQKISNLILCTADLTERLLDIGLDKSQLIYCIETDHYHVSLDAAIRFLEETWHIKVDPDSVHVNKEEGVVAMSARLPIHRPITYMEVTLDLDDLTEKTITEAVQYVENNRTVVAAELADKPKFSEGDNVVVCLSSYTDPHKEGVVVGVGYIFEENEDREYNVKFTDGLITTFKESQLTKKEYYGN